MASSSGGGGGRGSKVTSIDEGRDKMQAVSLRPRDQQGKIPTSYFIVPAQDTKGHSARIGARIPPGMFHEIEMLIQTHQFPWGTSSDFMRWSIRRGIDEAAEYVDSARLSNLRAQSHAMMAVCREEEEAIEFISIIDRAERSVTNLLSAGAKGPARKLVKQLLGHVEELDEPYWKAKYKKELERRFAHILSDDAPATTPNPSK